MKIVTHKNITPLALMKAENFRLIRKQIERCKENQRASLIVQLVKNLPAMQETWVRSLDREDPLEKEMATRSSNLAWKIPRTEEPGRL